MKVKYWIFSIILLLTIVFAWTSIYNTKPLYIAVSGPMTGIDKANGKAMVQGIQFYLDQINRQGGINGRPVETLVFDDQNKPELAKEMALKIVKSQAIAVLGHYTSPTSIAAAPIYKQHGIPAISGSATVDVLTKDNDWYFRTIFNNSDQGSLLANYARKILGYHYVDIIFDEDIYGTTLAESFINTAEFIGLKVRHRWHFNPANFKDTIANMTDTLLQDSPNRKNMVFFATHSNEALEAIVAMRKQEIGKNVKILGGDALSSNNFIKKLVMYPREQSKPGYYSDDIYVMAPFLPDLADGKGQKFQNYFLQKYQEEPTVTSALYHDTTKVLFAAIKKLETTDNLVQMRNQVKTNLWQFAKMEDAISGLTGDLFFNRHGDAVNSLSIGVYKQGRPIAAEYQYQLLTSIQSQDETLQQVLENKIIHSNGKLMNRARVVYVGIDFNEISEIDFANSIYTADFFLWFRFKGDFADNNIEFINAFEPDISLEQPIVQQLFSGDTLNPIASKELPTSIIDSFNNDLTVRSYRVKTTFKAEFDFHDYPLDTQILPIFLRHKTLASDKLIYVADKQGMKLSQFEPQNIEASTRQFFKLGGWAINRMFFFQNSYQNDSTLGMPNLFDEQQRIEYSQFNVLIRIKRYVSSFILKTMLPIVFLITLGYLSFFIASFSQKLSIGVNLILATSLFHLKLSSDLSNVGYIILMEYFFYLVYFLAIFIIFVALIYHIYEDKEEAKKLLKRIDMWGKIFYPIILFVGILAIVYSV